MDERFVETPYGRVYAQAAGDPAQPLVLAVHGLSKRNGWHSWEPLLAPLAARGFHVVSVDMPGWGRSSVTSFDPLDPSEGAAALDAIIADLGYGQARAIMGKSWGGGLAITLALSQPQRVQKLILTAPAFMEFDRLAGLSQPVLLAWAEDDPTIPVTVATRYEELVPDIELIIYASGGHSAAPANAGGFAPRAATFLDKPIVE